MAVERTIAVAPRVGEFDGLAPAAPSDLVLALRKLLRRPPALFGLVCVVVVVTWAVVPGPFAPLDPLDQNLDRYLKPPGYVDAEGRTYWLGTDQQGRDILSRVAEICLYRGAQPQLTNDLVSQACRDYFTEL